ncbi:16S rRNA (cytidine(1402)-2'-O)-methyltransferase [Pararobbsia silviterrae]|uniref:Ribosomal RNA small subunit methyltransferase I n=1 Tax=Pararobbsia silviterrae TaxID=1792498 RepID=A0A494X4W0_9BURK|nr:16S rRNA (cytidine(1402)-2'-O)-methyltransferase [Pararobbsia silviterrae]RKP45382.1 16S rRNA (cytidine(1402)-2'-O)-methyltransferase [Pararobbsia silviterrae]
MPDLFDLARQQHYPEAALFIVATPIGNLADIGVRALYVLSLVDRIAAEDTRNTQHMLTRYDIDKPVLAVHEHNEHEAAARVIEHLRAGERVAYVSDAGTPGISDPGARLVDAVRAANLPVIPLPGASAVTTALSVAGAWAQTFTFIGFLPTKARQRDDAIRALASSEPALVFYEAPHRVVDTVRALAQGLGAERKILIARELTKLHEALHVCPLAEGPAFLEADPNRQRGEFVLVVEGRAPDRDGDDAHLHDTLLVTLLDALPVKAAVKLAVTLTGASRNVLYARALELKNEDDNAGDERED